MYEITRIPMGLISETEEHDPSRAAIWPNPLSVKDYGPYQLFLSITILLLWMDTNRFNAAKKLNFQSTCVLLTYDSTNVSLKSWRRSSKFCISNVLEKINENRNFPL